MTDQTTTVTPFGIAGAPTLPDRPRICVACLAAYNNGRLHGCWIEATTPDEIWREVSAMLRASPEPDAEEWAIHGYEGFEGANLSEYASFGFWPPVRSEAWDSCVCQGHFGGIVKKCWHFSAG